MTGGAPHYYHGILLTGITPEAKNSTTPWKSGQFNGNFQHMKA
jgi:hypothetical protein